MQYCSHIIPVQVSTPFLLLCPLIEVFFKNLHNYYMEIERFLTLRNKGSAVGTQVEVVLADFMHTFSLYLFTFLPLSLLYLK